MGAGPVRRSALEECQGIDKNGSLQCTILVECVAGNPDSFSVSEQRIFRSQKTNLASLMLISSACVWPLSPIASAAIIAA
jgi:hypothetical protein